MDNISNNHLGECDATKHLLSVNYLTSTLFSVNNSKVRNNTHIINRLRNWNIILYKEPIKIQEIKP